MRCRYRGRASDRAVAPFFDFVGLPFAAYRFDAV